MATFPDFALTDISNLFMPFHVDELDQEACQSGDAGTLTVVFSVGSIPQAIACT